MHELKIDKSFVTTLLKDRQNAAIVRTTLQLAHNMNLEVVAEGVEDDDTLAYLRNAGCEQAQGFVLSRPVSAEDLLAWLSARADTPHRERRGAKRVFRQKT